jgi:formylglycine-generating enzyme required for sulfatase activity
MLKSTNFTRSRNTASFSARAPFTGLRSALLVWLSISTAGPAWRLVFAERTNRRRGSPDLAVVAIALMLALAPAVNAQSACDADIDADGVVGAPDIAELLSAWGSCADCRADLNGSGEVNAADLAGLLSFWGEICPHLPWATVLEFTPSPAIVTDSVLRSAIIATGYPWRVRDNGTGIEMLLVPLGTFDMGCSQGSIAHECYSHEQPVHPVTISSAFYLGRYEVTQGQWTSTMKTNPSYFQGLETRPVELVSWNTVQTFLALSALRLPSEAEWEFACRAGTTTPFHSGPGFENGSTDDDVLSLISWWRENAGFQTHAVGGKAANGFGLHDMLGNVSEWCADWYGAYSQDAQTDPEGPVSGNGRVLRGGSWFSAYSHDIRTSERTSYPPRNRNNWTGFRVARSPI